MGKQDKGVPWYDIVLAILALGCGAYHVIFYDELVNRTMYTNLDITVSVIGVLLTLEGARRVVGLPLTIVASFALLYAYLVPIFLGLPSTKALVWNGSAPLCSWVLKRS